MVRVKIFDTDLIALTEFIANNPDDVEFVVAEEPVANSTSTGQIVMVDISEETYQALVQSKIVTLPES